LAEVNPAVNTPLRNRLEQNLMKMVWPFGHVGGAPQTLWQQMYLRVSYELIRKNRASALGTQQHRRFAILAVRLMYRLVDQVMKVAHDIDQIKNMTAGQKTQMKNADPLAAMANAAEASVP
jgi:hypothetical protein